MRAVRYRIDVALLLLALFPLSAARPTAAISQISRPSLPAAASAPLLGRCLTVSEREGIEAGDCLQGARYELLEGRITLAEALKRLEACAAGRADHRLEATRSRQGRIAEYQAYLAFGEPPDSLHLHAELWADSALRASVGDAAARIPQASVARLRQAGITPVQITPQGLSRLGSTPQLRSDFAAAFGDIRAQQMADQLAAGGGVPATLFARSVVLRDPAGDKPLRIRSRAEYELALGLALRDLEGLRLRYLAAETRGHQTDSSIRSFLQTVRRMGREDTDRSRIEAELRAADEALRIGQQRFLDRLQPPPLIAASVAESIGLARAVSSACGASATTRKWWIRGGAGVVSSLVMAAGAVVATGATGTLAGGVVIAAALEASVGAYFLARTERLAIPAISTGALSSVTPAEASERDFDLPELDLALDEGDSGSGEGADDQPLADEGAPQERLGLDGEGVEEEGGEDTDSESSVRAVMPVLPPEMPDPVRQLPPILDTGSIYRRADLSLPDIKHRIDDFLDLGGRSPGSAQLELEGAIAPPDMAAMLDEAAEALTLWETRRQLHGGFGPFFVAAETERLPADRRVSARQDALGRYLRDRETYGGSRSIDELRRRIADRLVVHCRSGAPAGDLVRTACTGETALSMLIIGAMLDAGVRPAAGEILGLQAFSDGLEAVVYSPADKTVRSLTRDGRVEGVVAPIYHAATFYYAYLVSHQVTPTIDFDRHLVVALPDRPMPDGFREECVPRERSTVGRAVDFLGSLVGVRRLNTDGCSSAEAARRSASRGGSRSAGLSVPGPRNPLQSGGGQGGGGSGGGGGGGGGSPLAARGPRDSSGGGGAKAGQSGGASANGSEKGADGATGASADSQGDGKGKGEAGGGGSGGAGKSENSGSRNDGATAESGSGDAESGGGAGGSGGYGVADLDVPTGPNLTAIGRETVEMTHRYQTGPAERVLPWRLRADDGMITGSTSRVLYADNDRALARFDDDDLFLTLTPADVEAQRRMAEADDYPIYPAETTCDAVDLPPRNVFRRAAVGERPFRYMFCDQDESMVIFRNQEDARSYARLSPPDRPLYLARLAAERLDRFERSEHMRGIRAFLADPNSLRSESKEDLYAMVGLAGDILTFQNALESALVQSMNELGPSEVRSFYYEMHRQVLQASFFQDLAREVYRLDRRLASDPLQSLAWANAQPALARRGFFDLYWTLGRVMQWPERWAVLEERYGRGDRRTSGDGSDREGMDFLQILSEPGRVRIDWTTNQPSQASARDRKAQEGAEHADEVRPVPTLSDVLRKQDRDKHEKGGTAGLGRAGDGTNFGPEKGDRPLQMIHITPSPERGEPDRRPLPDDNQVRPGGTEGRKRTQTDESASRQEPVLWISPHTFIEAAISAWDHRGLEPESADHIPPVLRFNQRLRDIFLKELKPEGVYDLRLQAAMEVFTAADWLEYQEVRDALGGEWVTARAADTGRFSAAYSGNPPINDEGQIRIPNFFADDVILPADLFPAVSEFYGRSILGIFELEGAEAVPSGKVLAEAPLSDSASQSTREKLLKDLAAIAAEREEAPLP